MRYDYAIVIGRMQPPHIGHFELIRKALSLATRVIVVLGSAKQPRTEKNPFFDHERAEMITLGLTRLERSSVRFVSVYDYIYDDELWARYVRSRVNGITGWTDKPAKIAIVGYEKDSSSFYLKMFPEWTFEAAPAYAGGLSSTTIRSLYFNGRQDLVHRYVPTPVWEWLQKFSLTKEYDKLCELAKSNTQYRHKWGLGPFLAADAVVFYADRVLLVKRKDNGLWALPGGFVEANETTQQAAIRELKEETGLDILATGYTEFDGALYQAVGRSQRARIITAAHTFQLLTAKMPEVKGGDDAANAAWMHTHSIDGIMRPFMHDDHVDIIMKEKEKLK